MSNRDFDAETAAAYADEPEMEFTHPVHHGPPPEFQAPPPPPYVVHVIGSIDFDEPLVVQATLLGWRQQHQDRNVILWTTGMDEGAEAAATVFARANDWSTANATPESLEEQDATVTFAFVTPGSDAATFAHTIALRRPVRVFTVESLRPKRRRANW